MRNVVQRRFQFTRPRGARPARDRGSQAHGCFNSRAHGGRDSPNLTDGVFGWVSIHAPTGGATTFPDRSLSLNQFQFTRPRGARPALFRPGDEAGEFQFTRPRGARQLPRARAGVHPVSIHAPTGGATSCPCNMADITIVSIHAPTGGATRPGRIPARQDSFNSRAHGGRDPSRRSATATSLLFQFTRPRGARRPAGI